MTTKDIEKINNLLIGLGVQSTDHYKEIMKILNLEILGKESKTKTKLVKVVEKFIKQAYKVSGRPVLGTVCHKHNKQFICDGFQIAVFHEYRPELDILENTKNESLCLDYNPILLKGNYVGMPYKDKMIFDNIDKYLKWCKVNGYCKDKRYMVYFDGKVFNAEYLQYANKLFDNDNFIQIQISSGTMTPTQMTDNKTTYLVLPIRVTDEEIVDYEALRDKFLEELSNE